MNWRIQVDEFKEYSELEEILDSGDVDEECLTFIEAHGYLAATVISPIATTDEQLLSEIIGEEGENDSELINQIKPQILKLRAQIARELLAGECLSIPLSAENEDEYVSEMEAWSAAFMEKHITNEETWFDEGGETIAELLLPIVAASGFLEDEEIENIRDDASLYLSMLENIPEVVIDLYAIFHESGQNTSSQ